MKTSHKTTPPPAGNGLPTLRADPRNARVHTDANKAMIRASLEEVGAFRSIGVDGDGVIRAGNGVFEQAQALGFRVRTVKAAPDELIAVHRPDLKGEAAVRAALYDNRTGELATWNPEVLNEFQAAGLLEGLSLEEFMASLPGGQSMTEEEARTTLAERFGVPPFSVLDARQGYWQERKRAWLALGIQSEIGRGGESHAQPPHGPTVTRNRDGTLDYRGASRERWTKKTPHLAPTGDPRPLDRDWHKTHPRPRAKLSPGGSPRPAASLRNGRTVRGDGRGKPLA